MTEQEMKEIQERLHKAKWIQSKLEKINDYLLMGNNVKQVIFKYTNSKDLVIQEKDIKYFSELLEKVLTEEKSVLLDELDKL